MKIFNPFNNIIYAISVKLFLLTIVCFFVVDCRQKQVKQILPSQNHFSTSPKAVNINNASIKELETLPDIGTKTAEKIIEHREKFGKFRKPEHIILVSGISDNHFRKIQNLIKAE